MKNLVLGGSGMIGSHLCKFLSNKGEAVTNLDIKDGFDLRQMPLDDYKLYDYVWFFAWDVGGAKYIMNHDNSYNLLDNNLKISTNVFSFLKKSQIPFMFASTQLVNTDNIYGLSKIVGEEYSKLMNGKIVRFWNVYGWENPGEKSHVITDLVLQGLTKGEIRLMTNGEEERQFIHINDCVENLYHLKSANANPIHFTNNQWVSIKLIAEIIAEKLNCKLTFGNYKGYENKLDADETHKLLNVNVHLSDGIEMVIHDAKRYLEEVRN